MNQPVKQLHFFLKKTVMIMRVWDKSKRLMAVVKQATSLPKSLSIISKICARWLFPLKLFYRTFSLGLAQRDKSYQPLSCFHDMRAHGRTISTRAR